MKEAEPAHAKTSQSQNDKGSIMTAFKELHDVIVADARVDLEREVENLKDNIIDPTAEMTHLKHEKDRSHRDIVQLGTHGISRENLNRNP